MDAVAVADGETREALVFFIPRGYLLPGLLLKAFEPLVKVSDGLRILFLFLVVDSIPLTDGLYELFGEGAEPDWVADVKPLDNVSCRGWRDGIGGGSIEVGDRHEDGS